MSELTRETMAASWKAQLLMQLKHAPLLKKQTSKSILFHPAWRADGLSRQIQESQCLEQVPGVIYPPACRFQRFFCRISGYRWCLKFSVLWSSENSGNFILPTPRLLTSPLGSKTVLFPFSFPPPFLHPLHSEVFICSPVPLLGEIVAPHSAANCSQGMALFYFSCLSFPYSSRPGVL